MVTQYSPASASAGAIPLEDVREDLGLLDRVAAGAEVRRPYLYEPTRVH